MQCSMFYWDMSKQADGFYDDGGGGGGAEWGCHRPE